VPVGISVHLCTALSISAADETHLWRAAIALPAGASITIVDVARSD